MYVWFNHVIYLQFRGPKSFALCLIFSTRSIILPTRSRSAVSRISFLCTTSIIASRSAGFNVIAVVFPVLHPARSLYRRTSWMNSMKNRSSNRIIWPLVFKCFENHGWNQMLCEMDSRIRRFNNNSIEQQEIEQSRRQRHSYTHQKNAAL